MEQWLLLARRCLSRVRAAEIPIAMFMFTEAFHAYRLRNRSRQHGQQAVPFARLDRERAPGGRADDTVQANGRVPRPLLRLWKGLCHQTGKQKCDRRSIQKRW